MTWLRTEDGGDVRTLTIDRPERRNAIPDGGWTDLADAFTEFETSSARVLVIRGEGGDFCAGADVAESLLPRSVLEGRVRMGVTGSAAIALHRLTKPTIAVVDGVAVGAGMNLALGCDVVLASTRARFSEIFVQRALTIDFGGSWLLPRVVGMQRAKDLALSGRIVDAEEAFEMGLCLDVVRPEALPGRLAEQVRRFLGGAPAAQALVKSGLDRAWTGRFEDAVAWEGEGQAVCMTTEDFIEGVTSFNERRAPVFRGR